MGASKPFVAVKWATTIYGSIKTSCGGEVSDYYCIYGSIKTSCGGVVSDYYIFMAASKPVVAVKWMTTIYDIIWTSCGGDVND